MKQLQKEFKLRCRSLQCAMIQNLPCFSTHTSLTGFHTVSGEEGSPPCLNPPRRKKAASQLSTRRKVPPPQHHHLSQVFPARIGVRSPSKSSPCLRCLGDTGLGSCPVLPWLTISAKLFLSLVLVLSGFAVTEGRSRGVRLPFLRENSPSAVILPVTENRGPPSPRTPTSSMRSSAGKIAVPGPRKRPRREPPGLARETHTRSGARGTLGVERRGDLETRWALPP